MNAVILYRIDSDKRMHRYYRMDVQPDLFGSWCLIREWGRIGSRGQLRSAPYPTAQEAAAAFERQRSAKEQRGYYRYICETKPARVPTTNSGVLEAPQISVQTS